MNTIAKVTVKGQITIPVSWRRNFKTNRFLIKDKGKSLEIYPLFLDNLEKKEYTVFDAIRDNQGKGIKAKDLVKILKKSV